LLIMADRDAALPVRRINLSEEEEFDLGQMKVRPAERAVLVNDERRDMQPRVMQVLVALAKASPSVVSRDTLIEQCWDGRIVGNDSLNRCILALRHLAQEFEPRPFVIETVPRIGHRLVVPQGEQLSPGKVKFRTKSLAVIATILLVLAAASGFFLWQLNSARQETASIAVLPFRNLGTGDSYFAEGIGEEILSQLAHEPNMRVAGSSSSGQFGSNPDIGEVARRLNVDYVLEGSVRRQGDRVRVNAGLVRASDGARLWSDSYDGQLDDILSIQAAIGQAVADGLRLRLVHSAAATSRPVNGEAYALYLNARGLLRTRNPALGHDALLLLKRAIELDPRYAPAWSSLSEALPRHAATEGPESLIAALPQARTAARRALQIDPNFGAAHGNLGILLGYDSAEANEHFRRAAALDPRSSESQIWLGMAHLASAEFAEERAAYERAHALDPLWHRPIRDLAYVIAEMGDRSAAEAVARRGFANDERNRHLMLLRIAKLNGDFSEIARLSSVVTDSGYAAIDISNHALADARFLLNLSSVPPARRTANLDQPRSNPRMWMSTAPSAADWRNHNRSTDAALIYADENLVAAKLMLKAGRAQELVATYDGTGLLGLRPVRPLLASQLHQAPLVALALRAVGRNGEAERILDQADALLQTAYRRGKVPNWFEADAAAVWAVQGRSDRALDALVRAFDRGWVPVGRDDLPRLEDEPVFRSLHGDPRFERLKANLSARYRKERTEIEQLFRSPA
jgi:TolB-like protein/DNA-binding winged helix-turn-helix (wHTH) protein/Tfp pilus assembly protein PilF